MFSCQLRKPESMSHITYLNKVNEIDSIYRFKRDTLTALTMYQNLFKKYPPHNSYLIDEYQNYIILSDKYHQDFGGKESLYKLITLVAPNWKYNRMDKDFFALYKKYGIDSLEIESKVTDWKKGLNKILVDSFSIAAFRNEEFRIPIYNNKLQNINDKKNAKLFMWTFDNFGFPSLQKIGLWGNNDIFMPMGNILNHMADEEQYSYFKERLLEYVKTGECTPEDYAIFIDKRTGMDNVNSIYGLLYFNGKKVDTATIDKNRKKIGMPSLKHSKKIHDDYFKH